MENQELCSCKNTYTYLTPENGVTQITCIWSQVGKMHI